MYGLQYSNQPFPHPSAPIRGDSHRQAGHVLDIEPRLGHRAGHVLFAAFVSQIDPAAHIRVAEVIEGRQQRALPPPSKQRALSDSHDVGDFDQAVGPVVLWFHNRRLRLVACPCQEGKYPQLVETTVVILLRYCCGAVAIHPQTKRERMTEGGAPLGLDKSTTCVVGFGNATSSRGIRDPAVEIHATEQSTVKRCDGQRAAIGGLVAGARRIRPIARARLHDQPLDDEFFEPIAR